MSANFYYAVCILLALVLTKLITDFVGRCRVRARHVSASNPFTGVPHLHKSGLVYGYIIGAEAMIHDWWWVTVLEEDADGNKNAGTMVYGASSGIWSTFSDLEIATMPVLMEDATNILIRLGVIALPDCRCIPRTS